MKPDEKPPLMVPELPDYVDESMDSGQEKASWFANSRNRKLLVCLILFTIFLFFLPSLYRSLKGWRAGRLLARADISFATGDSQAGLSQLKQALALAPGSPVVQHAVEIYNARSGDKASMGMLLERMRSGKSENDELLAIAEIKNLSGESTVAVEAESLLAEPLTPQQKLRRVFLDSFRMAREGSPLKASEYCLAKASGSRSKESELLKIQAARYLLSVNEKPASRQAVEILMSVSKDHSQVSLAAWRILAKVALSLPPGGEVMTSGESSEAIKLLPSLSGVRSSDRLDAAELEIHQDPSCKEVVIKRLMQQYQKASRSATFEFARWLNRNGLPAEVLSLAGSQNPREDTEWLLLALDAQSALGRWNEIDSLLSSPAGAGVPDAVKHLYLARTSLMMGKAAAAGMEWRNVWGALPLEKPETLAYIAAYEEQIGAPAQALLAYRELANRKETRLPGLLGLIRCQPRNTSASVMIPLYQELLAVTPDLTEAVGDLAYLKLLKGEDVAQSSAVSEKLLIAQPDLLARMSAAALGRLRLGDIKAAMAVYGDRPIDWNAAPEPWKAVRVAVLLAAGEKSANVMASTINPAVLRPEEQRLLKTGVGKK